MSIEYTIDIQLTELGFSDILQPLETSVRETPCRSTPPDDSLSPSHPPASLSAAHKQRLRVRGQQSAGGKGADAKQTSDREQTTVVSAPPPPLPPQTLSREPLNAEVLRDEQAVEGAARSEATVNDPTARPESTDLPQQIAEQGDNGQTDADDGDAAGEDWVAMQQDVEEDSDDSEVSEVYEEEEVDEDNEEEEGQNNESNHSAGYCCSVCDLQLPSKFKLQDHMNLHTGARPYCCAECGKRFCQIYNYRVHLRTHAEIQVDRLMCRVCLTGFASQEDLKDHLSKTHFEDKFYECDLCKRVFTSLKACQYHVQLHKRLLNGICKLCGRKFSSTKLLARHQKKICQCNFKCTDCTKTFTKKNALLKHSFSHLGLLPYTCIRCRCHFRLAKLYRQHKCEPERINCVACLREFLSQEDFQQHKKDTGCWGGQETKGNEIRCLECGQRFDTSEELKKHAGAHQRVLKCAECGKGFRSALLLMSHMGGHAGKSPCLCQSCGLGFPHQQNYDSHLKTCGQTPQPASTQKHGPKKHKSSKTSSSETEKLNAKPGLVTGGVSVGSSPPDGLWKLTLHEQPPPGAKLVLFLPVCPTRTNGLALQSAVSQTLSGPDMQVQPQAALSPVHFGVNTALGLAPKDLGTGIKQDPDCKAPLDLSMKCNPALSAPSDIPLLPTKNEPDKFENSANGTKRQEFKNSNSKAIVKLNPGETDRCAVLKQFKMDPMDLSLLNVNTTSSGLIIDIKKEPQSPGPDVDLWSSRSCQLTEKEIKMEVDGSCPAYTDVEK